MNENLKELIMEATMKHIKEKDEEVYQILTEKDKICTCGICGEKNISYWKHICKQLNQTGGKMEKKYTVVEQKLLAEVMHWEMQSQKYGEWADNASTKLAEAETVLESYRQERK